MRRRSAFRGTLWRHSVVETPKNLALDASELHPSFLNSDLALGTLDCIRRPLRAPGRDRGHDLPGYPTVRHAPFTLRRPPEDPSRPRAHRRGGQPPAYRRLAHRHSAFHDSPLILR